LSLYAVHAERDEAHADAPQPHGHNQRDLFVHELKRGGQHPDHFVQVAVNQDRPAENGIRAAEAPLPIAVGE
jgi:hypothetical protein